MEKPALILLLGMMTLLSIGCSDRNTPPEATLNGTWELRSAKVNGKLTQRMNDLFFTFSEDGTLYTNILGTSQEYVYLHEDDRIVQNGETTIEYLIHQLLDTSLILTTSINGAEFEFILFHPGGD